jgi:predicted nucleotidyltransferase
MATTRLAPDFKEFLQLLRSAKIEYLLIGGYAVGHYGFPRATGDLDIWVATHDENATRLVDTLRRFGFDVPELNKSLFQKPKHVVRMGVPPVRLEILSSIDGVEFQDCYRRRENAVIDGVEVDVISLADLKTNKRASGRHQDLTDLEKLP